MSIKSAEFGFRLEIVLNLAQRERKENDRRAQQTGCCRGFNFKFNHPGHVTATCLSLQPALLGGLGRLCACHGVFRANRLDEPLPCSGRYLSSSTLHSSTRPDNMSSSISDLDRVSRRVLLIVEDCKEIVGL